MNRFDVVIIGSGIAGSAAAIGLLEAGCRVAIFHAVDQSSGMESISQLGVKLLGETSIRVGDSLEEIAAAWRSSEIDHATVNGAKVASRQALAEALRDQALADRAVQFDANGHLDFTYDEHRWRIRGGRHHVTAEFLIDATGRSARVGRLLGARRRNTDSLVACSAAVAGTANPMVWIERGATGWWSLVQARTGGTLSYFAAARALRGFQGLHRAIHTTRVMKELIRKGPASGSFRAAGSSLLRPCAGDRWLAVGDAAFTAQPLSSSGVAKALLDARRVLRGLADPLWYDGVQNSEFFNYSRQLAAQYAIA